MATPDLKAVDIPWPYKGMNTASPPSELDQAESPWIQDAVVTPYELRPRQGTSRIGVFGGAVSPANAGYITNVQAVNGQTAVQWYTGDVQSSQWAQPYAVPGFNNVRTPPAGFSLTPPTSWGWLVSDTGGNSFTAVPTLFPVFGRSVVFDNISWTCSDIPLVINSVGGVQQSATGVMAWAGAKRTTVASFNITLSAQVNPGDMKITGTASGTSLINSFVGLGRYRYRIASHTAGSTTYVLDRPYGYDDPSVGAIPNGNVVGAGNTAMVDSMYGATCLEVHKSRLFAGRTTLPMNATASELRSYHVNAISWSYPGNGWRWPAQNYMIVDEDTNDPIMGLASCPSGLLIFKRSKTGILTGNDETSFQYRVIDTTIGCISDTSIHLRNGVVYWMSDEGVVYFDGSSIKNLSRPSTGRGVLPSMLDYRNAAAVSKYRLRSAINSIGDRLFVTEDDWAVLGDTVRRYCWVYDFTTGAWSTAFGSDSGLTPVSFIRDINRLYAVTTRQITDITACYQSQYTQAGAYKIQDDYFSTGGASASQAVPTTVDVEFRPAGRDTIRMQEMEIHHNCQYAHTASIAPLNAWTVKLANDTPLDTAASTSVFQVKARYLGLPSAPDYRMYFSDRATDTNLPGEGVAYRARFTVNTGTLPPKVLSYRLMVARCYFNPTTIRQGRIDDSTL